MEGGDWKWQGGDPPVHQLGRTVPAAGVDPLSLSPCRTAQIWVLFASLEIRDVIQKWLITFEESYSKPKAGHLKRWHSCPGCPSSAEHRVPGCELRVPPSPGPGPCLGGWRAALASGLPGNHRETAALAQVSSGSPECILDSKAEAAGTPPPAGTGVTF